MKFVSTSIPDVVVVEPEVFGDARGLFCETWHDRKFSDAGIKARFVQANHSRSERGVLRGIHYQIRQPQGKLVRVVGGEVFDVVVDLRRSSATFGQWVGVVLSEENMREIWVPPGFGHGFLTLSDRVDFLYKCTDFYAPEHERCIIWDDPDIGIKWPLGDMEIILSQKDKNGVAFKDAECFP